MKNLLGLFSLFLILLTSCGGDSCIECSRSAPNFTKTSIACDNGNGTISVMDSTNSNGLIILEDTTFPGSLEDFETESISDGLTCK